MVHYCVIDYRNCDLKTGFFFWYLNKFQVLINTWILVTKSVLYLPSALRAKAFFSLLNGLASGSNPRSNDATSRDRSATNSATVVTSTMTAVEQLIKSGCAAFSPEDQERTQGMVRAWIAGGFLARFHGGMQCFRG